MAKQLYHLYVIQLKKTVLKHKKIHTENPDRNIDMPCVYVGQTCHLPEYRFEQHLNGYKSNKYVKKYGYQLIPDLYEEYNPITTRKKAEMFEEELALKLREEGYTVWYG